MSLVIRKPYIVVLILLLISSWINRRTTLNTVTLLDASVDDLQRALEARLFTSEDLVQAYTDRIEEVNHKLKAVTELNPDALSIAKARDKERQHGMVRGPLHGLPVLVKDNIATFDKLNNTAGSHILLGSKVPRDATVVSRLREAGAIILGKANMSQWAAFRSSNTSSGWSSYGGQCYAAYLREQSPSGSSSGSAVAVSLGLVTVSLGTETHGSILLPASVNNIVGIKPTVGLTSRSLVVPISETEDTVGPLAKTVKDAAYVLQAIAGVDPEDRYTASIPNDGRLPDYVAGCRVGSLRGKRIGVPKNVLYAFQEQDTSEEARRLAQAFYRGVDVLRSMGAVVVDSNFTALGELMSGQAEYNRHQYVVMLSDFTSNIATYLSRLAHNPRDIMGLEDIRRLTIETPEEDFPTRDVDTWKDVISLGFDRSDPRAEHARREAERIGGEGGIFGAVRRYRLDAVVLPTTLAYRFASLVGSPAVSVPLGAFASDTPFKRNSFGSSHTMGPNHPFGIAFLGLRWSERDLIAYAFDFEQRTRTRENVHPYFKPTTEVTSRNVWSRLALLWDQKENLL